MDIIKIGEAFVIGYLLGGLNAGVIVGKIYGKDIRNYGSKSAGLTNTLRVLGKTAAALVLVGDVAKGVLACYIGLGLGAYVYSGGKSDCVTLLAAGAGAVIGHNWPPYFGFKGGKGALTGIAVLFMLDWRMALICLGLFIAIVALTRYVSLGTMLATFCFFVISFFPIFNHTFYFSIFSFAMAFIIIFKHRLNVRRLLSGTENKLAF